MAHDRTLDPVTFEVLKNSFVTVVDEMAEQILRTCHSFVIFSRDFSCALHDARGDTIMQGSQDIAVHVGTLHLKAKAVLEDFEGDIHEGDVFAVNDPYRGGTHFPDVSLIRPVFADGELIALAQANGHWADVGGSVPGSFDVGATDHFGEGIRVPPVRVVDTGTPRDDVIALIATNSRAPGDIVGDCHAQIEATRVAEQELFRLIDKYGARGRRGGVRRRAGLRRAAHPRAHRRPARRHVGDDRPRRLRPGRRGGPGHGAREADDLRRRDRVRPQRLGPGDQELPQLGRGRRLLAARSRARRRSCPRSR